MAKRNSDVARLLEETKTLTAKLPKGKNETETVSQPQKAGGFFSMFNGLSLISKVEDDVPATVKDIPDIDFNVSADDLSQVPFSEVYEAAGVPSSTSVDELATMLQDPDIASQPTSTKAQFVEFGLKAKGIDLQGLLNDARLKDQALDAYQKMLSDRYNEAHVGNEAQVAELTKEVEAFIQQKQSEMDTLRQDTAEKSRQSSEFTQRRITEEKRLSELITPFLKGIANPVSVGNTP